MVFNRFKKLIKRSTSEKKDDKVEKIPVKQEITKEQKDVSTVVKTERKRKSGSVSTQSQLSHIIIKPIISEKASELGQYNQYIFEVDKRANKITIARAFEEIYGIKPVKVRVMNRLGKTVRYGRTFGRRKATKKAIITLQQGDKIEIYEGV